MVLFLNPTKKKDKKHNKNGDKDRSGKGSVFGDQSGFSTDKRPSLTPHQKTHSSFSGLSSAMSHSNSSEKTNGIYRSHTDINSLVSMRSRNSEGLSGVISPKNNMIMDPFFRSPESSSQLLINNTSLNELTVLHNPSTSRISNTDLLNNNDWTKSGTSSVQMKRNNTSPAVTFQGFDQDDKINQENPSLDEHQVGDMNTDNSFNERTDIDDLEEDIVVDILPSFHLYQALHRHIPVGNLNPDHHAFPPTYSELSSCRTEYQDINTSSTQESSNAQFLDDIDQVDDENIFIDKIYSLRNRNSSSVVVDIKIMKRPVRPNTEVELESMLKEYTSGDIIHGYVTICNVTTAPIKFEMFYVSLEGYMSMYDPKNRRKTIKRFLRSVDMSASWSYSHIEISSGMHYEAGAMDQNDGTVLGLSNDRTLLPKVKYKKYFMFKLPNQLLDSSCKHEHFKHCQMPPSFGLDRYFNNGQYAGIEVNPILCYGHNGIKASPILTTDLCPDYFSINYSIDAKIVGLDQTPNLAEKQQKHNKDRLYIIKDHRYNLRFIPFSVPLLEYKPIKKTYKTPQEQISKLETLLLERLNLLQKFLKKIDQVDAGVENNLKEKIQFSLKDIHGEDYIDVDDGDTLTLLERKLRQLYVSNTTKYTKNEDKSFNRFNVNSVTKSTKAKDMDVTDFDEENDNEDDDKNNTANDKENEKDNRYAKCEMSYTVKSHKNIFNQSTPDNSHSGIMFMKCAIPAEKSLPYIKPSLLRKSNKFENKNKHDQQNWKTLMSYLGDDIALNRLDFDIKCVQANNVHNDTKPPDIQIITSELLVLTSTALAPVPINLNCQFLHDPVEWESTAKRFTQYKEEIERLQEKFETDFSKIERICKDDLQMEKPTSFTDFISKDMNNDVLSLSTLSVKEKVIKEVFSKQTTSFAHLKKYDSQHVTHEKNAASSGGGFLKPFKSRSSDGILLQNSGHSKDILEYREQCLRNWVLVKPRVYKRRITVHFELNKEIQETLVPTFESCLSARRYMIRLNVKFENHTGTATLDVPVVLKFYE